MSNASIFHLNKWQAKISGPAPTDDITVTWPNGAKVPVIVASTAVLMAAKNGSHRALSGETLAVAAYLRPSTMSTSWRDVATSLSTCMSAATGRAVSAANTRVNVVDIVCGAATGRTSAGGPPVLKKVGVGCVEITTAGFRAASKYLPSMYLNGVAQADDSMAKHIVKMAKAGKPRPKAKPATPVLPGADSLGMVTATPTPETTETLPITA